MPPSRCPKGRSISPPMQGGGGSAARCWLLCRHSLRSIEICIFLEVSRLAAYYFPHLMQISIVHPYDLDFHPSDRPRRKKSSLAGLLLSLFVRHTSLCGQDTSRRASEFICNLHLYSRMSMPLYLPRFHLSSTGAGSSDQAIITNLTRVLVCFRFYCHGVSKLRPPGANCGKGERPAAVSVDLFAPARFRTFCMFSVRDVPAMDRQQLDKGQRIETLDFGSQNHERLVHELAQDLIGFCWQNFVYDMSRKCECGNGASRSTETVRR